MNMKPRMYYRVVTAHNPKTNGKILRPIVANRNTLTTEELVSYARNANYVFGQQRYLEGVLAGFVEAIRDRAKAGYAIKLKDLLAISGHLAGTVGENRALTSENEYRVTITAARNLKIGIDDFVWTRVKDEGIREIIE